MLIHIWNTVGDITGLRSKVVRDDRTVLPYVKKALRKVGYKEKLSSGVPSSGWQHAVRRLGNDKVVKYSSCFAASKVKKFINYLEQQREILHKYCSPYLTADHFIYVPLEGGKACYAVVKDWVVAKPLYRITDEELETSPGLVKDLLDLLQRGEQMFRETGYALDLAEPGMFLINFLNPRKTGNIVVDSSNKPFYVDTVLIPSEFDPSSMPGIYRYSPLWYFIYKYGIRLRGRSFEKKLRSYG
jgi:hypothetical protein